MYLEYFSQDHKTLKVLCTLKGSDDMVIETGTGKTNREAFEDLYAKLLAARKDFIKKMDFVLDFLTTKVPK